MVSYIKGTLLSHSEDRLIVLIGGFGLEVFIPSALSEQLPSVGKEIELYTHLHVKEDALTLYGFSSSRELSLFKMLISVGGVGPKGGLSLLSCLGFDSLVFAIHSGDAKKITSANGIGKKTAERIIIDLRDKLSITQDVETFDRDDIMESDEPSSVKGEAIQALVSLGYGRSEAASAVGKVKTVCNTVEELLKESLKYIF